jgi:cysteinyl-tRNA synthetase
MDNKVILNAITALRAEAEKYTKQADALEAILDGDFNRTAPVANISKLAKAPRRTRGRRSKDEVNQQAQGMLKQIQDAGDEGISGRELNRKWGKVIPTIKQFIESRVPEAKIKTKGLRSAMRYFAA